MKTITKLFRILALALCSLIWLSKVQAQPFGENILIVHDAVGQPDSIGFIYLEIVNEDNFLGFQVDLPLPVGFTYVSGSAMLNPARRINHLINGNILSGTNILRIISFAITGGPYIGNSGIIAKFSLNCPTQTGIYTLVPQGVIIGCIQGGNIATGAIDGSVFIMPQGPTAGDANCDGFVNVNDVIIAIQYVLGVMPKPFCFANSDLNHNLLVNVADVVGTVNIILSHRCRY